MPRTMNEAVTAASAVLGLTPSAPSSEKQFYNVSDLIDDLQAGKFAPVARLPLTTTVRLVNGVEGVISGHSTASANRYRISWYDRKYLTVRHRWSEREDFEVIATNETATAA